MTEPTLSTALAERVQPAEVKTVADLLARNAADLAKKLPRGLEYEYFRQAVLSEMRRVPKLFECEPASVVSAVCFALQLGLTPGPLGHCYLVPYKTECTFVLGYKGMIDLAYRSGLVKDVSAELVHEGDLFRVVKGTSPKIVHEPAGAPGERPLVAAYAVGRLKTGGTPAVPIYPEDWERAQKRSAAGSRGQGPWETDFSAMVRKTAVRRLAPLLPQAALFALGSVWDEHPAPPFDEPDAIPPAEAPESTSTGADGDGEL